MLDQAVSDMRGDVAKMRQAGAQVSALSRRFPSKRLMHPYLASLRVEAHLHTNNHLRAVSPGCMQVSAY